MKRYILPVSILVLLFAAAVNFAFSFAPPNFAFAQTVPASCVNLSVNLALGSRGTGVTELQTFLHANGFLPDKPTGYYGAHTLEAVKSFQSSSVLPVVGSVGPLTRAFLQKITCSAPQTSPAPASAPEPIATSTATATSISIASTSSASAASTTAATSTDQALPYAAQDFSNWTPAWGSASTTNSGSLLLEGSLQSNGAEAIFPASMNWSDYRYQANISVANGNISMIARYLDANNFLSCSFATGWVEIDQVYNGTATILASKSVDGILPGTEGLTKTTSVSMDVKGDQVGCAGYGPEDNVTATLPDGSPTKGGIGVESWYATPMADKLELLSVKVDPL